MIQKVAVPSSSERGSKRRLRSIKRESAPADQGDPIRGAREQRAASRGTRLRERSR